MKFRKLLLLACLCTPFSHAVAAPFISSVDTSNLGAGILTINGNNFGSGPNVDIFDTFDSGSASAGSNISLNGSQIGAWSGSGGQVRYATQSHSGNHSAEMSSPSAVGQLRYNFNQGIQETFASFWVRVPNGAKFPGAGSPGVFSSTSSWKFSWLIDQDYQGNSSDVCLPTHTGNGNFMFAGNDFNMTGGLGNNWWSWNSWVRIAVWVRANPSNPTASGDVLFHTVSQEKGVAENWMSRAVFDADGPALKQYQSINLPGWTRSGGTVLYDDIYIASGANAISHVELTDSPNYSQSRTVAIQPSSSWSGNRITVNVNQGGFSSLNNVYLYVWDKDGNRNSTGYPLSGGVASIAPPNYPGNIQ